MKTYKKHITTSINPLNGRTIHEDKRASKIDSIFEHEIEMLNNQYEHNEIDCQLRFNSITGYYWEMSINDEETNFSDKTTEDIKGRSKAEIVFGLKNSYSYLVEALECHKKECENEIYSLSKYGHEADFSNY